MCTSMSFGIFLTKNVINPKNKLVIKTVYKNVEEYLQNIV